MNLSIVLDGGYKSSSAGPIRAPCMTKDYLDNWIMDAYWEDFSDHDDKASTEEVFGMWKGSDPSLMVNVGNGTRASKQGGSLPCAALQDHGGSPPSFDAQGGIGWKL